MARLSRITQTIFASLAGLNQIAEFGSLAQGSPAFTTDPAVAQTATFAAGWFSAVLGNNSPAMEDVNALFFVITYQLAYLMQLGVPEWNSTTTYYIGSLAQDGAGKIYVSRTNSNLNNALSSATNWKAVGGAIMTALGDLVYGDTNGAATRLAGNTTTTKKYLTQTGDGVNSAAPTWAALPNPTIQRLTSGSGTYTTPAGVRYIKVRVVGGGGGGGGGGTGTTGGTGGTGGTTSFGSSLLTCTGGDGGVTGGNGGAGGSATVNSPAVAVVSMTGSAGQGGPEITSGAPPSSSSGGNGGTSPFGGTGGGAPNSGTGTDAIANSGSGGGGSSFSVGTPGTAGGGGGSGGFIEAVITGPSATYSYVIGASGTAGSAGTSGNAGGAGGSGVVIVEEFYQ